MILSFKSLDEALAVPDPKHVWINFAEFVVYTEQDIPVFDTSIIVSAYQLREALNQTGLRTQVEAAIAAGSQTLKDMWQYKKEYDSEAPEVLAIGQAIGKTESEIRDVFALAAGL